jgi:hypothetical protein
MLSSENTTNNYKKREYYQILKRDFETSTHLCDCRRGRQL